MLGDGEEFFVYDRRGKMAKADAFKSRYFARLKDNEEGGEMFKCALCKEVFSKKAAAAKGKEAATGTAAPSPSPPRKKL
jgi:hypothetical protein